MNLDHKFVPCLFAFALCSGLLIFCGCQKQAPSAKAKPDSSIAKNGESKTPESDSNTDNDNSESKKADAKTEKNESKTDATGECIVNGKCVDVENKSIVFLRPEEDGRHGKMTEAQIVDGKFRIAIKLQQPECFVMAFGEAVRKGYYRTQVIFLEPGVETQVTVHPEQEFEKNEIIAGSVLNKQYSNYRKSYDEKFGSQLASLNKKSGELFQTGNHHSAEMKSLLKKLNATKDHDERLAIQQEMKQLKKDGKALTEPAKKVEEESKQFSQDVTKWHMEYFEKNPTIVSYYLLYDELIGLDEQFDPANLAGYRKAYEALSKKHDGHPYNESVKNLLAGISTARVGMPFVDFSAPDLKGNVVKLSDKITGKVALIDLWATWCGPCIAKSKAYVPVYKDFKEKGFVIVGVAGEFDDTENLEAFLKREDFPWLHLVELDQKHGIWTKYGVSNQGGAKFLVDKKGIIRAIDPTADELRKLLGELLD